jgi:hypothetical protein
LNFLPTNSFNFTFARPSSSRARSYASLLPRPCNSPRLPPTGGMLSATTTAGRPRCCARTGKPGRDSRWDSRPSMAPSTMAPMSPSARCSPPT